MDFRNYMMLGAKGILPPTDAYELLRCKAAHTIVYQKSGRKTMLLLLFFFSVNIPPAACEQL